MNLEIQGMYVKGSSRSLTLGTPLNFFIEWCLSTGAAHPLPLLSWWGGTGFQYITVPLLKIDVDK